MSYLSNRAALVGAIGLAMAAPVFIAAWMANGHGQARVQEQAAGRAAHQMARASRVSEQMESSLIQFRERAFADRCGRESILMMRQMVLSKNLLLDVGVIEGNELICSSFGNDSHEVGPPSYLSSAGYLIRLKATHPMVKGIPLTMTTDAKTGYTVLVHPDTMLEQFSQTTGESHGLVGVTSGRIISSDGGFDERWLPYIRGSKQGSVLLDGSVLAWQHSDKYDYASFASVSAHGVAGSVRKTLAIMIPVGLVAGVLISVVVLLFLRHQSSMPALIRAGLRHNEFYVVYQPIINLETGAWAGAEALIRWRRATGEMVSPDTFIPIAETSGLIGQITARVLDLIEADGWPLFVGDSDFFVSINFSAKDFGNQAIVDKVAAMVKRLYIDPHRIHIEATERVFMDIETTRRNVARLRDIGVKVSIDDFGTGYSSLSQLAGVEVDALKIDRVFVQTVGTGSVTSSVISHIIALAKGLNLKIIAEGVETEEQADYLRRNGVEYVQGWLYSKPMDAEQLGSERLRRQANIEPPKPT